MRPLFIAIILLVAGSAQAADRVEAGKRVFARCAGCHEVGPGARNGFGPQLNGIVGRKAGSAAGYAYSPAMKASPVVWNERKLAAFLRDGDEVVPGNRMRFFGFFSQGQMDDLMVYLRAQSAQPAGSSGAKR